MDADVGTMYIHILVVISTGSRVFSTTISHALTPAVVMIAHNFLIIMHAQCLKTIHVAPDKLVLGSITHIPLLLTILLLNCFYVASGIHLLEPMLSNGGFHHHRP